MRFVCGLVMMLAVSLCSAESISGRIVGVVDGDTVDLLIAEHDQVRIRVAGIDTPEKRQAFGQRAKEKMAALVFGKPVVVETEKHDRYGRVIGKVMVGGIDAGLSVIESGLAWHYKKYEREQTLRDRGLYSAAEDRARVARIGLWQDAAPIPPWDWRKGAR